MLIETLPYLHPHEGAQQGCGQTGVLLQGSQQGFGQAVGQHVSQLFVQQLFPRSQQQLVKQIAVKATANIEERTFKRFISNSLIWLIFKEGQFFCPLHILFYQKNWPRDTSRCKRIYFLRYG